MKKLPISLLIPTMNRPKTLEITLKSYLDKEFIPSQVVVVDQSTDKNVANEVESLVNGFSSVTEIIYYTQAMSLTYARNTLIKYAKEEIVIFSDDDVEVYNDTVKNVYELMNGTNVSMVAGIDDNSPKTSSKIGYLLGTKSFKKRKIGHVTNSMLGRYPNNVVGEVETEWAMGYFFAIKKPLFEKWELTWDENLTSYAYPEDLDFSYSYFKKSKEENLICILSDKVRVKHLASKEYRVPSKLGTYMYVINRAYLSYKHNMGLKSRIAMSWCNFWRYIERVIKKENPKDMKDAIKLLKKHKKEIKKGKFPYNKEI